MKMTDNRRFRYGNDTWQIGDRVENFTIKRPRIQGTVTNLTPINDGNDFLVHVAWPNAGNSSHKNGARLLKL